MKATAVLRMGVWEAGPQNFSDADVLLAIGYNPMASSFAAFGGLQGTDPFVTLRQRKAEGLKLIVVDPRRTELATQADIHLQVKPGESGMFLQRPGPKRAQVIGPFGDPRGPESRFRGLRGYNGEMPCTTLAQEIATPGPEQVRALIVNGGNPVAAWPDQSKTLEAMEALDLLVVIDHRMTQTAFADYVFAPRLSLERADVPPFMDLWFRQSYACYTPAVVEPEGDLLNDWEVYWELAERLGVEIELPGGPMPGGGPRPSDDAVLDLVYANSRVPLDVIRANNGRVLPEHAITVEPPGADASGRFQVGLGDHMEELAKVRAETTSAEIMTGFDPAVHTFRLISRRLRTHLNSLGGELPGLRQRTSTNYAYMHPDDLAALGLVDDDVVRISSPHAALIGVVQGAPDVRRGVVSMAHSWGSSTGTDEKVRDIGAPTNRLIDVENGYCPITGQAIQSAIPVSVEPVSEDALVG